jgi:hypothetical protein
MADHPLGQLVTCKNEKCLLTDRLKNCPRIGGRIVCKWCGSPMYYYKPPEKPKDAGAK